MNPKRWAAACVLGCLVLATLLLPPPPSSDEFTEWTPRSSAHERTLVRRLSARHLHAQLLDFAYRGAHDADVARREFGAQSKGAAPNGVSVWFDSDVPTPVRQRVSQLIGAEEASRGTWRGKSGVGVLVLTDTASAVDGVQVKLGFNTLISSTTMVRPVPQAGGRCVTIIRIGRGWLQRADTIAGDRHLLDGCAFYDAFGSPGAQIRAWMDSSNAGFARALSFAPPDSVSLKRARWGFYDFWYSDDRFVRCAGNKLQECSALLREPTVYMAWRPGNDASVPMPVELQAYAEPSRGFNATLLDAMVRDIGPERFERVWQSPKSLDAAYLDATGEPLAAWVHRRAVTLDGPYHIGPLPTTTSAILTLATLVLLAGLTIRFAQRPRTA
ncbi:MAG TPA: hypothetical protein VGI97_14440 [Gemmatimonadaceae bacterium]